MDAIVDFNGFLNEKKQFVVKEFGFFDPLFYASRRFNFKSPPGAFNTPSEEVQIKSGWVGNSGGSSWNEEGIPISKAVQVLKHFTSQFANVYVRGEKKRAVLEELLGRSCKLLNCPQSKDLPPLLVQQCKEHKMTDRRCALNKAIMYGMYFRLDEAVRSNHPSDACDGWDSEKEEEEEIWFIE